jgi:hypothetical protein
MQVVLQIINKKLEQNLIFYLKEYTLVKLLKKQLTTFIKHGNGMQVKPDFMEI